MISPAFIRHVRELEGLHVLDRASAACVCTLALPAEPVFVRRVPAVRCLAAIRLHGITFVTLFDGALSTPFELKAVA